jgi:hypothetical protein
MIDVMKALGLLKRRRAVTTAAEGVDDRIETKLSSATNCK